MTVPLDNTPSQDAPLHLSPRVYHRVLEVSHTIADLDGADLFDTPHVAEALQYRKREGDWQGRPMTVVATRRRDECRVPRMSRFDKNAVACDHTGGFSMLPRSL